LKEKSESKENDWLLQLLMIFSLIHSRSLVVDFKTTSSPFHSHL